MNGADDHRRLAAGRRRLGSAPDQASGEDGPVAVPLPRRPVGAGDAVVEAELANAPHDPPDSSRRAWRAPAATILAVSAGGLLGAEGRYLVDRWASERWGETFPWGTFLVNAAGSFALAFYLTLATERFVGRPTTRLFLATGFLGAFTTFSAFSYETVQLARDGDVLAAFAYVVGSLLAGLTAGIAGIVAAHAL